MIVFRSGDCIIRAGSVKVKSPFPAASHRLKLWFILFSRLNRYRALLLRAILCSFTKLKKAQDCQAKNQHFKNKTKYLRPKVSKEVFGCCCQWQKQTIENESPLVGRWGKAPYPKMLRYLFLEMFGLNCLTVPLCMCVKKKQTGAYFSASPSAAQAASAASSGSS